MKQRIILSLILTFFPSAVFITAFEKPAQADPAWAWHIAPKSGVTVNKLFVKRGKTPTGSVERWRGLRKS